MFIRRRTDPVIRHDQGDPKLNLGLPTDGMVPIGTGEWKMKTNGSRRNELSKGCQTDGMKLENCPA